MTDTHQIHIIRKNNQNFVSISTMPVKDVYVMLHSAIETVSESTGQSFRDTLTILANLDDFAKEFGQRQ